MFAAQSGLLVGLAVVGWLSPGADALRRDGLREQVLTRTVPGMSGPVLLSKEQGPARVVLIGNIDTGKSTLCQWLLARTDVCQVWSDPSAHSTEMELATGYWFGDESLGALEVLDTPGFQLTEADGAAWVEFTTKVRTEMQEIDAVILLANPNGEASSFTEGSLNKIRQSFGSDIWENIINFVPVREMWRADEVSFFDGMTQENWNKHVAFYKNKFEEVEFNESTSDIDWSSNEQAQAKVLLEQEIDGIGFYGAFLKVVDGAWPMVSAHQPDFNVPGYSCPADCNTNAAARLAITKLEDLANMRTEILAKRAVRQGTEGLEAPFRWDVQHLRPRFGPSEVTPGQTFTCKWPHDCRLDVVGTYLSDADVLQIFPKDHVCGNDFAGFEAPLQSPVENLLARAALVDPVDNTQKSFLLGLTSKLDSLVETYKVCYCAFGYCTHPARFFREAGTLTVENTKCQLPCEDPTVYNAELPEGVMCGDDEYILAGDSVQYTCAYGHGLLGNHAQSSFLRQCDSDGKLDVMISCPRVQCFEEPDVPGDSTRQTIQNGQEYRWEDPVYFLCDKSYTIDGHKNSSKRVDVVCGATGLWEFAEGEMARERWLKFLADGGCKWVVPWLTIGLGSAAGLLASLWIYVKLFGAGAASASSHVHSSLLSLWSGNQTQTVVQAINSTFGVA